MKHYIYVDKEIVNSYISQIYGGIIQAKKEELETSNSTNKTTDKQQEKIKSAVEGGIKGILSARIEAESGIGASETEINEDTNISREIIEKVYHDNLLDNLIEFLRNTDKLKNDISKLQIGDFIESEIVFNFINHEYIKRMGKKEFKESFIKIMNSSSAKNDENEKNIKKACELMNNFNIFYESIFPTNQMLITEKIIVPLYEKYLREDPNMIEFKYGGKVKIVGKITKFLGDDGNKIGLYNEIFVKALNDTKKAMENMIFINSKELYVVTPIALYFE